MSFNKCYVKSLEQLQEQFQELGLIEFKRIYVKRDSFIGPSDAIEFIMEKLKK